jgi:hypothetical protein
MLNRMNFLTVLEKWTGFSITGKRELFPQLQKSVHKAVEKAFLVGNEKIHDMFLGDIESIGFTLDFFIRYYNPIVDQFLQMPGGCRWRKVDPGTDLLVTAPFMGNNKEKYGPDAPLSQQREKFLVPEINSNRVVSDIDAISLFLNEVMFTQVRKVIRYHAIGHPGNPLNLPHMTTCVLPHHIVNLSS